MAKVISTRGISYHIEEIIRTAREHITIVTPYLKIPEPIYERLLSADKRNINITFVYGKSKLNRSQERKLKALANCEIYFKENLHAKVYINERAGVICSMNLYDYSEINNSEIGVYFERQVGENCLCSQTENEIKQIIEYSDVIKGNKKQDERKLIHDFITYRDIYYIENFPVDYLEINKDYGFVTYEFKREITNLKKMSENLEHQFMSRMERYRVFWNSPYDRIHIYPEKNISFKHDDDELEYLIYGITETNNILREYLLEKQII